MTSVDIIIIARSIDLSEYDLKRYIRDSLSHHSKQGLNYSTLDTVKPGAFSGILFPLKSTAVEILVRHGL